MIPLRIVTDRRDKFSEWLHPLNGSSSKPLAITPVWNVQKERIPFLVPYFSDFGNLSFFIPEWAVIRFDLYELLEQAKDDKFRAVYLLDGNEGVMLFRNKYCERLTPEYVMSAPIEELQSLAWAGKAENVGTLTMKPVGA